MTNYFIDKREEFIALKERIDPYPKSLLDIKHKWSSIFPFVWVKEVGFLLGVYSSSFLLEELCSPNETRELHLVSADENAESYFFANFKKYPAFRLPVTGLDMFHQLLFADPGGSSADAIAYNCDRFFVIPDKQRWLIYADRPEEKMVVASCHDVSPDTFRPPPWISPS